MKLLIAVAHLLFLVPLAMAQAVNGALLAKLDCPDRVKDIFADQVLDPRRATRHNIAQILIYLYLRTSKRLGRLAMQREIDRYQILHSQFYKIVFGSWERFESLVRSDNYAEFIQ